MWHNKRVQTMENSVLNFSSSSPCPNSSPKLSGIVVLVFTDTKSFWIILVKGELITTHFPGLLRQIKITSRWPGRKAASSCLHFFLSTNIPHTGMWRLVTWNFEELVYFTTELIIQTGLMVRFPVFHGNSSSVEGWRLGTFIVPYPTIIQKILGDDRNPNS